jgi:hypothetical protein
MAIEPTVKPQTWAANSKDIVGSVADWMLVECVASNTRWNTLTDGDALVLRGMELATNIAEHRGIVLGTMTLTPGELLKAMQDMAVASNAPTHPLPPGPPVEPVVTSATPLAAIPVVTSGGSATTAAPPHEVVSGGTTTA